MLRVAPMQMRAHSFRDPRVPGEIQRVLEHLPSTLLQVFESHANPDPTRLHVHVITPWQSELAIHLRDLGFRDEAFDAFYVGDPAEQFQYLAWYEPRG